MLSEGLGVLVVPAICLLKATASRDSLQGFRENREREEHDYSNHLTFLESAVCGF